MTHKWAGWGDFRERVAEWRRLGVKEFANGAVLVGHVRHAPLAYLFGLHAPLSEDDLRVADAAAGRLIPEAMREFYRCTNGAHLFSNIISIGGLVETLTRDPNAPPQPIDLRCGNAVERPPGLPHEAFVIGGLIGHSVVGQVVMSPNGVVRLVHPRDGTDIAAEWPSLGDFLASEFGRLAALHDDDGVFLGEWFDRLPSSAVRWDTPRQRVGVLDNLWRLRRLASRIVDGMDVTLGSLARAAARAMRKP
jgi:hypothetical protein